MLDFVKIVSTVKETKTERNVKFRPKFIVNHRSKDLMVKGGDFYAIWNEKTNLWSTNEQDALDLIDSMIKEEIEKYEAKPWETVEGCFMWDADSGSIDRWHKFVQKQMRDNFIELDQSVMFANSDVKREDYASKKLPYALEEGSIAAYEEIISTLYDPTEREKLEWAIGSIVSGDSKHIQKFEVLYGDKGTGKGTILDIIDWLFDGYTASFSAKDLGNANNAFALESFKNNPLVAINGDGNLSRIEDNTKINMLVSHEKMEVNAKYTKIYTTKFNAFLFMGSNHPVKITDAKSGILRRLIDVHPSGRKIPYRKYHQLKSQVKFELGAIAWHCFDIYKKLGEDYYENYVPLGMMAATNDFYDFVEYHIEEYEREDMVTLAEAWKQYDEYCTFANSYKLSYRLFRNEFGNYWKDYEERGYIDGKRVRSLYRGFRSERFENPGGQKNDQDSGRSWLELAKRPSVFDQMFKDCPAQGCKDDGSPQKSWKNVKTRLEEIDTGTLHWVKPPESLICIDFDIKNEKGEKDLDANIKAALKWKPTYAEVSRSGKALHLYYIYSGDVSKLSELFAPYIEVKVFTGGSSLRRMLTLCNSLTIATISSGLPLKGEKHVTNLDDIKNEKHLRALIAKALTKRVHADTTSNVDFIKHVLDVAYDSGMSYDVTDMLFDVLKFAEGSSNQKDRCVNTVGQMMFKSKDISDPEKDSNVKVNDDRIVFFDIEIYRPDKETKNPGLFLICWKYHGAEAVDAMINPKPHEVEELLKFKLAGFNCRNYDNMMLHGASIGYSNQQLYDLSQDLIVNHARRFPEAANYSYIDVYDMCTEKMSLKKWEIKLGITHKEMGIPWDEPAPLDRWDEIISYCKNDVVATEAVFDARQGDFRARQFQVKLVELLHGESIKVCINDTTNTLSKRIIFGNNRSPQMEFNYRDLSKPVGPDQYDYYVERFGPDYPFRVFDREGLPLYRNYIPGEVLPEGFSILPFFPGYICEKNEKGKLVSTYLGESIGEGGRVYSRPGYWAWVWDGDISSQHPHSIMAECLFGPTYTKIFSDIVKARVAVKHHDFKTASTLLNGALEPFLTEEMADDIAQALKIVINSIYGLTSAKFTNEFRDQRNYDNIVAKRGALFMTLLKQEVEKRGAIVCHIKTDSIKIPNATDAVKEFVIKFGREFGYEFETEDIFTKFCLFNDAAYIGLNDHDKWVTKADQFKEEKQPFLFKTLFSHEPYEFKDFCETKSVTEGALYLDFNEEMGEPVDEMFDKEYKKLKRMEAKNDPSLTDKIVDQEILCEKLWEDIPNHHNYQFVGRVGRFTPVIDGAGGGKLYRKQDGKYFAATGSTGYRWMESDFIKDRDWKDFVNVEYYRKKVDEAKAAIEEYVDSDFFLSKSLPDFTPCQFIDLDFINIPEGLPEEVPFDADYVVRPAFN